ncbi:MAG: hypothetical protein ACRCUM_04025, partial [Mycoplasmoidaceae bacterium]
MRYENLKNNWKDLERLIAFINKVNEYINIYNKELENIWDMYDFKSCDKDEKEDKQDMFGELEGSSFDNLLDNISLAEKEFGIKIDKEDFYKIENKIIDEYLELIETKEFELEQKELQKSQKNNIRLEFLNYIGGETFAQEVKDFYDNDCYPAVIEQLSIDIIYEDDIAEIIKYYNNDLKDLDIDDIIELENYEDLRNDSFYYLTSDA